MSKKRILFNAVSAVCITFAVFIKAYEKLQELETITIIGTFVGASIAIFVFFIVIDKIFGVFKKVG